MKQQRLTLHYFQNQKVDLILRGDPSLTHYAESIPDLWREALLNLRPIEDAIEEIWSPVIKNARGLIFRIVNMTRDLSLVVSAENSFPPNLYYMTHQDGEFPGWLAGSPAAAGALLSREEQLGISLPGAYASFARIHNGLLENGDQKVGLLPIEQTRLFSNPVDLEAPDADESKTKNLLAFCVYRSGNMQCFDLSSPIGAEDFMTVQWDRATQRLSQTESFWAFMKRFAIDFLT